MPAPTPLRPIARRALAAQSDERLVKLVREGHEPAFEEMVRRYRGPLVGFAAAIVSADGAEDVVQASLEKAHRALLADSREITLRPWLFAIVRNGALNAIRGEPRVDELGDAMATSAGPSEIAEQRGDLDRLVVAMCALPEAQRQALVKRELEGVGHGEIAAQLGTTANAVRGLIFRARTGLRDALGAAVPLPLLRTLLTEAPAAGVAGGGAGAGAAALIGGGSAAKGGAAIAAAVVALGTGIAIDQGRGDEPSRGDDAVAVERRDVEGAGGAGEIPATGAPVAPSGGAAGASGASAGEESGADRSGGGGESGDDGAASGEGDEATTAGPSGGGGTDFDPVGEGEGGDDSGHGGAGGPAPDDSESEPDESSGPSPPDGDLDEDGESSGPGSEPAESGSSGSGSSGSGSSGSGSGSSGSGSSPTPPPHPSEPEDPVESDDGDSSGSGGGSGSGSGDGGDEGG